jgi:hypothetical protein
VIDPAVVKERRIAIQQDAPCEGCGLTLAKCLAARGKDPTAPPWFGCCARGTTLRPCMHVTSGYDLLALIKEIESGSVRSLDEVLLHSVTEHNSRVRYAAGRFLDLAEESIEGIW